MGQKNLAHKSLICYNSMETFKKQISCEVNESGVKCKLLNDYSSHFCSCKFNRKIELTLRSDNKIIVLAAIEWWFG